jgi:hypothetical protein
VPRLQARCCGRLRPTAVASLVRFEGVPGEIQSSSIEFSNAAVTPSSLASSSYRTRHLKLDLGGIGQATILGTGQSFRNSHGLGRLGRCSESEGPLSAAARAHSRPVNTLTPSWREMDAFLLLWLPRLQRTSSSLTFLCRWLSQQGWHVCCSRQGLD